MVGAAEDEQRAHLDVASRVFLIVDAAHAEDLAVFAAGVADALVGVDHFRVPHLAGNAELGGQVGGADEQHVNPVGRRDFVGVVYGEGAFQHHDGQNFVVDRGLGFVRLLALVVRLLVVRLLLLVQLPLSYLTDLLHI